MLTVTREITPQLMTADKHNGCYLIRYVHEIFFPWLIYLFCSISLAFVEVIDWLTNALASWISNQCCNISWHPGRLWFTLMVWSLENNRYGRVIWLLSATVEHSTREWWKSETSGNILMDKIWLFEFHVASCFTDGYIFKYTCQLTERFLKKT